MKKIILIFWCAVMCSAANAMYDTMYRQDPFYPLHQAAICGNVSYVMKLRTGAKVDMPDFEGHLPL